MKFQKKILVSLFSLMLAASVAACSSSNIPLSSDIKGSADFSRISATITPKVKIVSDEISKQHIFIDVGNGKKGGSFSVNVNLSGGNPFKVKTADGTPPKVVGNILSLQFWLISSPATPAGILGGGGNYTLASSVSLGVSGTGTHTATFTNVPDNTGGDAYYVAAAAYDNATPSVGANICNATAGTAAPLDFGSGDMAFFSTTGGGGAQGPGSVQLSGSLIVGGAPNKTDLNIFIKLEDGIGASVTGTTTVTPGGYAGTIGTGAV